MKKQGFSIFYANMDIQKFGNPFLDVSTFISLTLYKYFILLLSCGNHLISLLHKLILYSHRLVPHSHKLASHFGQFGISLSQLSISLL